MRVDIGIFAYNEERNIDKLIIDLSKQSIWRNYEYQVRAFVLANGCVDNTVYICNESIRRARKEKHIKVVELEAKGKSATWNTYVHKLSCSKSRILIFMDADITFFNEDTLDSLVSSLVESTSVKVVSSCAIKDIQIKSENLTIIQKLIVAGGANESSQKHSICGQLYAANRVDVDDIYMPIGLPVEDGFLRAMILTDSFQKEECKDKVMCTPKISHKYESISSINELIHHQVRIVIGSAINTAIYRKLRLLNTEKDIKQFLKMASEDENKLIILINESLPKWPYGYIRYSFITKRAKGIRKNTIKGVLKSIMCITFDFIIYIIATKEMARRKGVGYW